MSALAASSSDFAIVDALFDFLSTRARGERLDAALPDIIELFAKHYTATWCDANCKSALVLVPAVEMARWTHEKGTYKKYRQTSLTFTRTVRAALIGRANATNPEAAPKSLSVTHLGGAIGAVPADIAENFCLCGPGPAPEGFCSTTFCFYVDMSKLSVIQSTDANDLLIRLSNKAGVFAHKKRAAAEAGFDEQQAKRVA